MSMKRRVGMGLMMLIHDNSLEVLMTDLRL